MNESELRQFYRENLDRIYKFFYFKTIRKDLAEDLTSQTFLRFVECIKNGTIVEKPSAFLSGIAKNVFMEFLREKYENPISEYVEIDFERYISEFSERVEEKANLEDRILPYIQLLPDSQRQVAYLRFIEKFNLKEICDKLNKDMNYVKTTQKRAIASLKKLVTCTP